MHIRRELRCKASIFFTILILIIIGFFVSSSLSSVFAASKIPKVRLSIKPLDLSRTPTTEELMAAGQLGGQLYPTADIDLAHKDKTKAKRNKDINLSFGQAIQEWNKHNYKKAVKMFRKHAQDYPDSPWTDEALLHVGCDARYNGRYTEAEEMFTTIITKNKDREHFGAKMLRNKARSRLAILRFLQSNFTEATSLFAELKKDSPDWRHRTYASHWIQRISRYKGNELALLNCGTQALAQVLKKDRRYTESREVMEILPDSLKGHSIKDLISIASKYEYSVEGLRLQAADLQSIPLPAIVQIDGKREGNRGHYWVLEKIENGVLTLFDSQSNRRFNQSTEEFSREWDGNTLVFSDDDNLPGIKIAESEMEHIYGACCGNQRPGGNLGNPDKDKDKKCNNSANGAPVWKVNTININLFVTDIPLWYDPPIGPSVRIQLSYNSQSGTNDYEPFGNKWMFNYASYSVEDPGGEVTFFMPDGRRDMYTPDGQGGYIKPVGVFNTLTKIAENHFELEFPDGTVYVYNIPSGTSSIQPFLVEIRDAYGQKLLFGYNSSTVLIETITDALGRVTTLVDSNSDGLIEQVNDPFGRSANFEYNANSELTKITDMGGIWTEFGYDVDTYLAKIENQRGIWDFYIEPADGVMANSDNYPPPGDGMWENYRITITNPMGGKEEYFYYGGVDTYLPTGGYSWYVSPRDYIPYLSNNVNTYRSNVPKTRYIPIEVSGSGRIEKIQYPEGGYVEYKNYDPVSGRPQTIDEFHGNDVIHTKEYTYNSNGRVTSYTDVKDNVYTYKYYSNNIDLENIKLDLISTPENDEITLKSFTYNGSTHDVATFTDRLLTVTEFGWDNTNGQLTSVTQAKGTADQMTTGLVYDAGTRELASIQRDSNTIASFSYDSTGRVETYTNSTGFTLTYHEYNNLDQPTKITFPDTVFDAGSPLSTYIDITYSTCCPRMIDIITDRGGVTTTNIYDAAKRLTEVQGPNGTVKYEYDANGNRTKLIDADNKTTEFEYDLDNRVTKKIYADGKFKTYEYDLAGLLEKIITSRNIEKEYTHDEHHNMLDITYSDATPGVTYTYDDYDRLDTMTDGTGVYDYGYDDLNRLTSIDGPWTDDTITYTYNDLGQVKTMTPQNGQAITYFYDYDPENPGDVGLGRLKDIDIGPSGTNKYTYNYTGVNPLIQSLTRPNGSKSIYSYDALMKRLTEIRNEDSSQAVINRHAFTFNDLDVIDTETIETGTVLDSFTEGLKTYDYNNVNQLLSTTNPSGAFQYDDDGNMTQGYTPDGYQFTAVYDAENRLTSLAYNNGASNYETKYFYSGDSMLAKVEKWDDTVVPGTMEKRDEVRFVRAGVSTVQERDEANAVTREFTWGMNMGGGIGGLLNLNQGGQDYSYLYDGKGNVMAVLDNTEAIQAAYRYDTFGNLKVKTGTLNQPFQFSTKRYDEQTGLSYYGYRFYNPAIGSWMTRDPLGEAGGINLYGFVQNNPVNFVDHWGLSQAASNAAKLGTGLLITPIPGARPLGGTILSAAIIYASWEAYNSYSKQKKPKPGSKPKNCPPGTIPIDEYPGLDRQDRHDIKDGVDAGQKDWTGIAPDGSVITGDSKGEAVVNNPYTDYLP